MNGIRPEHVISNLLVCRMKRDIDRSRATKMLLQMLRPKLKMLAKRAIRGTNIDLDTALADMESATVEYILKNFIMGERAYLLHYLFGQPMGVMHHYASNYARKTRRWDEFHVVSDELLGEDQVFDPYQDEEENDLTRRARAVVDDGISLNLAEYRTMRFCLTNATEAKRPLNGLHVYLSRAMGVVRARTTRIYSDACRKLRENVQEVDE